MYLLTLLLTDPTHFIKFTLRSTFCIGSQLLPYGLAQRRCMTKGCTRKHVHASNYQPICSVYYVSISIVPNTWPFIIAMIF